MSGVSSSSLAHTTQAVARRLFARSNLQLITRSDVHFPQPYFLLSCSSNFSMLFFCLANSSFNCANCSASCFLM